MSILDTIRGWFGGGPDESDPCQRSMAVIQEFLDGELPEDRRQDVAEHFRVCTRCYPHLRLEEAFRERVRTALSRQEVPDGLRSRVLDIIATEEGEGTPS